MKINILKSSMIILFGMMTACSTTQTKNSSWYLHECGNIPDIEGVEYCFDQTTKDATETLVFFHGAGDGKDVLTNPTKVASSYPDLIRDMPPLKIIVISWGPAWMLTNYPNRTKKPTNATTENAKKAIAYLVHKYALKMPARLMGHSQGGSNAAMMLKAAPELFDRAVLINPMLLADKTDPWSVLQYCPACLLVKGNYETKEQWQSDRPSPFFGMPPVLVHAVKTDTFGLYAGAENYVTKARAKENKVTFLSQENGDHWHYKIRDIVEFMSRIQNQAEPSDGPLRQPTQTH